MTAPLKKHKAEPTVSSSIFREGGYGFLKAQWQWISTILRHKRLLYTGELVIEQPQEAGSIHPSSSQYPEANPMTRKKRVKGKGRYQALA